MIGIYKITNVINDNWYIGQSNNIEKRWKEHNYNYQNNKRKEYDFPLYRAFRKYGIENFNFEVIEICNKNELLEKEQYYYELYNPNYNQIEPMENPLNNMEIRMKHLEKCKNNKGNGYNENSRKNLELNRKKKKIKAIELDTNKEIIFNSMMEAEKELNINRSSISQIINPNHNRKKTKGYTFVEC